MPHVQLARRVPLRVLSIALFVVALVMAVVFQAGVPLVAVAADPERWDTSITRNGAVIEATFNNPDIDGGGGTDNRIGADYVRLVNGVPSGSYIRAAIFQTGESPAVYDAFVNAKARGAVISIVQSAKEKGEGKTADDIAAIPGITHKWCQNAVTSTTKNEACLSSLAGGKMHIKLALFSKTKDKAGDLKNWVIWISSANFSRNSGKASYNNAITIYNDKDLYDQLQDGLWTDLRSSATWSDYYTPTRGKYESSTSGATIYITPESSTTTDIYTDRLDPFKIYNANTDTCLIYSQMAWFKRTSALNALKAKANSGCTVKNISRGDDHVAAAVKTTFSNTSRMTLRCAPVHDKTVLISAKTSAAGSQRYFVFAGSHNFTDSAQHENDELLLKIESKDLYDAYLGHFRDAWANSSPGAC